MNETALPTRPATVGQLKEIGALLLQAIPGDITFEVASEVIGQKSKLIQHIQGFFPEAKDVLNPRKQWESFYQKALGLTIDLSAVVLPPKREGFDRLIIVAQGLTLNRVFEACFNHFGGKCWRYNDDLDTAVPKNDRDPKNGSYAIWIRDRVEADEELQNRSANDLAEAGVKGITLLERMLFELKYFLETGKHLDIKNVTLCNGSRHSDGNVPDAHWSDGKFNVGWDDCGYRYSDLRSRGAVSL